MAVSWASRCHSSPPPAVTAKHVRRHCPMLAGSKSGPAEALLAANISAAVPRKCSATASQKKGPRLSSKRAAGHVPAGGAAGRGTCTPPVHAASGALGMAKAYALNNGALALQKAPPFSGSCWQKDSPHLQLQGEVTLSCGPSIRILSRRRQPTPAAGSAVPAAQPHDLLRSSC